MDGCGEFHFVLFRLKRCEKFKIILCIRVLFLNTMQSYARFLLPQQKKFQLQILRHERLLGLRQRLERAPMGYYGWIVQA